MRSALHDLPGSAMHVPIYFSLYMNINTMITTIAVVLLLQTAVAGQDSAGTDSASTAADSIDTLAAQVDTAGFTARDSAWTGPNSGEADTARDSGSFAAAPAAQDSADTLARAAMRDSIAAARKWLSRAHMRYPASPDSAFVTELLLPHHIFSADASSISEIISNHPAMVKIPFALASSLSRVCFYGLPSRQGPFVTDNGAPELTAGQLAGTDIVSAAEIAHARIGQSGEVGYTQHFRSLVNPHVLMWWESGVFDENALNVRFSRPLGRHVDLGAYSSYRYLQRDSYSTSGSMKDLYDPFISDTSILVNRGINPLTREHISGAQVAWLSAGPARAVGSYRYADIHDDIAYEYSDSSGHDSLRWEERSLYAHTAAVAIHNLTAGRIGTHAHAYVNNDVTRTNPVAGPSQQEPAKRGEAIAYGAGLKPYISLIHDTAAVSYAFTKEDRRRYSGEKWSAIEHRAVASYERPFEAGAVSGKGLAAIGYAGLDCEDSLEHALVWKIDVSIAVAGQKAGAFAMRDRMPVIIPYDTSFSLGIVPGSIFDRYRMYGAHCVLFYKKTGLYIGAVLIDKNQVIDPVKLRNYWPRGMLPYEQPGRVLVVAPMLGRWYGIALSSSWMFSNTRPYIKSHSAVSFHSPGRAKRQRLFIDVGLDYWSWREPLDYGGTDTWNRPIYDVNAKFAVQIKTFRLYYKISNILNRKNAYVPGYFLPGITYRWGFNWLLGG
jgi:hypothetical protein